MLKLPWGMLVGLVIAAIVVWFFPHVGGLVAFLTIPGVFVFFLVQGLVLPTETVVRGIFSSHLHVFCQLGIFVMFPLIVWFVIFLWPTPFDPILKIGFIFLSFMPTTVATSAANTAQARGMTSGAIFNTTLSNVLGVFITPFVLAGLLTIGGTTGIPVGALLLKVASMILLPMLIGQSIRIFAADVIARYKSYSSLIKNGVILFIVFVALCGLRTEIESGNIPREVLLSAGLICLYILLLVRVAAYFSVRLLADDGKRQAAFFCVSQKSLATGLPMALAVFALPGLEGMPTALCVMPLTLYHPSQLFADALIASWWSVRRRS